MQPIKKQLYALCLDYVRARIDTAQQAIEAARLAAGEETKSSAGDKYETGRAMMQLEMEKNASQLAEAMKLKSQLDQVSIEGAPARVQTGSLVITSQAKFFIAISAGRFVIDGQAYLAISPSSPVGAKLIGLSASDSFSFNNQSHTVLEIW